MAVNGGGEQFVSSFLTSARNNFTFLPRMHKVSTGYLMLTEANKLTAGFIDTVSLQIASLYLRSIEHGLKMAM